MADPIDPQVIDEWLKAKGWYRCRCKKWGLIDDPSGGITCWPDEWAIQHQMRLDLHA